MTWEGDRRVCDAEGCGRAILWSGYVTAGNRQHLEDIYGWRFEPFRAADRCCVCTGEVPRGYETLDYELVHCSICGLASSKWGHLEDGGLIEIGWEQNDETGVWYCNVCSAGDDAIDKEALDDVPDGDWPEPGDDSEQVRFDVEADAVDEINLSDVEGYLDHLYEDGRIEDKPREVVGYDVSDPGNDHPVIGPALQIRYASDTPPFVTVDQVDEQSVVVSLDGFLEWRGVGAGRAIDVGAIDEAVDVVEKHARAYVEHLYDGGRVNTPPGEVLDCSVGASASDSRPWFTITYSPDTAIVVGDVTVDGRLDEFLEWLDEG